MYQLFEIALKTKEIRLEESLNEIRRLNWYPNGLVLVKDDDGLQYVLDLTSFTLQCNISDLFPLSEGGWLPEDFLSREELVNSAITELRKLPFDLEILEIRRTIKHD